MSVLANTAACGSVHDSALQQKCLLDRKRSYLTEKGLFSRKAPSSGESTSRAIFPSHGEKPAFRASVWARRVQRGKQRRISRGAWRRQAGILLERLRQIPGVRTLMGEL